MKHILSLLLLMVADMVSAQSQELNYTVSFAFVKCADVRVNVFGNQDSIKISATAKSCGLTDFFVKVDEQYDCFLHPKSNYLPYKIEKVSKSGDSVVNINLDFNQTKNIVTNSILGNFDILPNTYDFLSGLLLISDSTFFKEGNEKQLNIFFDNSPCILSVKYCGNKYIGNLLCKKIELKVTNLSPANKSKKFITLIPSNSTHYLWLTDSQPSYLVLAKINLVAGSLKMELISTPNCLSPRGLQSP